MKKLTLSLIGFGEVGQILAADFINILPNASIQAWDIKFSDDRSIPSIAVGDMNIHKCISAGAAPIGADIIISVVTAAQTCAAAQSIVGGLSNHAFYLDLNSASPKQKQAAADVVNGAGGRYVEGAVMSPITPKRLQSPILLGGPFAHIFKPVADQIGMTGAQVFSDNLGKASAAKMCRSVLIKGMESLLSESLLSARYFGVEDTVIGSLSDLFPGPDWQTLAPYMISRSLEHGGRRAEEMREVAKTVSEAGQPALMSSACAKRQDIAKGFADSSSPNNLTAMLDDILAKTTRHQNKTPNDKNLIAITEGF